MSIFIPTTCQYCPIEIPSGSRCKKCSEERDSQGVPFIVYCEVWHFQRRPGQQHSFWVYENRVARTSPQLSAWVGKLVSELQMYLEAQGYEIVDIVPPLGEIDLNFFAMIKSESDENT